MSAPVAFAVCRSYADSAAAVRRALDALGGPARFFKPGCRVLIKPNLLTDAEPARAVTTHPEIVRALIRLAREAGASPCVADSPAGALRVSEVWEKTGFRALCEQEHTPLLNLEKTDSVAFLCDGVRFTIAKPVLEADLVVNAPKVKTHSLTLFTGAIKNLYGTIPGFQKANLHTAFPTPQDMGRLLATIADTIRPGLSVADGVVGMDGNGPSAGHPIPLGFVAASPDPVALDAALCGCLGIPLNRVSGFRHVERARHQDIALLGEPPAQHVEISPDHPPPSGARAETADLDPAHARSRPLHALRPMRRRLPGQGIGIPGQADPPPDRSALHRLLLLPRTLPR